MDITQTFALITILLQVSFLEGILSLDNAAVLGAIVLCLPADEPVPWPHALRFLARPLNPLFGKQRTAGLRVGLLGAYLGRGLMLVMASFVIRNPWLQLAGALYLLKISIAELGKTEKDEVKEAECEEEEPGLARRARGRGFWSTVLMVELMDLAFSLDNVVVVVSLTDKLWLVMLGVAIGILTMRFAASIFSKLIERIPSLGPAAYVLVFDIGLEFILVRVLSTDIPEYVRFSINVGTLLLAVVYDRTPVLQRLLVQPFRLFHFIFSLMDRLFSWVLFPFGWVFGRLFGLIGGLFRRPAIHPEPAED